MFATPQAPTETAALGNLMARTWLRLDIDYADVLQGNSPLDQLPLQAVDERRHVELVIGRQPHLAGGAVEFEGVFDTAKIVAVLEFLASLIDGVVDFLQVDASGDVERRVGGHRIVGLGWLTHRDGNTELARAPWRLGIVGA